MMWEDQEGKMCWVSEMTTAHIENACHMIVSRHGTWRSGSLNYLMNELRRRKLNPYEGYLGPMVKS